MIRNGRDRDHGIPAQLLRLTARLLLRAFERALQRGVALDLAIGLEPGAQRTGLADALGIVRGRIAGHVFLQVRVGIFIVIEGGARARPPLVHRADDSRGDVLPAMVEHLVHGGERKVGIADTEVDARLQDLASLSANRPSRSS